MQTRLFYYVFIGLLFSLKLELTAQNSVNQRVSATDIVIGNYVWLDADLDGEQDLSESGMMGIPVFIYKYNGTIVGKTSTDAGGFYYFNDANVDTTGVHPFTGAPNSGSYTGLADNATYYVLIPNSNNGIFTISGNTYKVSPANSVADNIDSDAVLGREFTGSLGLLNGNPYIQLQTGAIGAKDSTYDVGMIPLTPEVSTRAVVSNCFDSNGNSAGGVSTVTIQVTVDWQNNPNNQNIIVSVPGASSQTFSPNSVVKPYVLHFDVPNTSAIIGDVTATYSITTSLAATPISLNIPAGNCLNVPCQSGNTGGMVFYDYNENGIKDIGETAGAKGITVSAYWVDGASSGDVSTSTDAEGQYEFVTGTGVNQIPAGAKVRIEFTGIPTGYESGSFGSNSGTSIQFITSPLCNVDFGINYPEFYAESNPRMIVPKMNCGDPLLGGSAATSNTLVAYDYGQIYSDPLPSTSYAQASQTGSLWGTVYHEQSGTLFSTAIGRRHVGYGPLGTGGIYATDLSTGNTTPFLDLQTMGVNTGLNTHIGLPANFNDVSADSAMFHHAAKVSLGGVDVSEDGEYLWVMNLNDKELVRVEIGPAGFAPLPIEAPTKIVKYSLASFSCNNGELRPWAVKQHQGEIYVGVVCDASNGFASDLNAKILKLDQGSGLFSLFFEMSLGYPKGSVSNGGNDNWHPWTENHDIIISGSNRLIYPQPILSSIAFDADNSLILGFMDRLGLQTGKGNVDQHGNGNYEGMAGGDILRAYYHEGVYQLETNAKEGLNSSKPETVGMSLYQGPDGGEFFWDDRMAFSSASVPSMGMHQEVSLGSVGVKLGSGEVYNVVYDANHLLEGGQYSSGGMHWYSNETGARTHSYMVFNVADPAERLGKSGGLGDVELIASQAPIEIGNRVWFDTNKDGIQNPDENGIENVILELYVDSDMDGVPDGPVIASTTTSATGQWYFNLSNVADGNPDKPGIQPGLMFEVNYLIQIAASQYSGTGAGVLNGLILSPSNVGGAGQADARDNDGVENTGIIQIPVFTGTKGQNNHSYDIGFNNPTLPIEMLSFTAQWQEKDALLRWTTTSEVNVKLFEIDRSFDGQIFERIATVNSKGSPTSTQEYRFVDAKVGLNDTKNVYYRLITRDIDGSMSSSNIVELHQEKQNHITLNAFPNPVTNTLHLNYQLDKIGFIEVVNTLGERVYAHSLNASPLLQLLTIDTENWSSGIYYVRISDYQMTSTIKVVK